MAGATLTCPSCGAALREEDVDDARGRASCAFCGALTQVARPSAPDRPLPTGLPAGLVTDDDGRRLRIVRRWSSPIYFFLLPFTGVWFALLALWYGLVSRAGAPTLFLVLPLLHVALGLGLAYVTLAGLLNRTTVEVERGGRLSVRHGPVPWRGRVEVDVADLAQVFVSEKRYEHRDGAANSLYAVEALTHQGRRLPLVRGMIREKETAWGLEQAIEGYLRLPDRPVAGELPRA